LVPRSKPVRGTGQAFLFAYSSLSLWHKLCGIYPPKPIACWHSLFRQISQCFGRSDGAQVGRLRSGVIPVFAHTRTLKALIVRRRFGNRSVSTGNMPVFLVVMYVDKEFGHMFKFRCSRAVICDNMSFTYAYLYIYVNIFMYIYTYILVHIYTYTHICVARRTVLLFIAVCILFRAYGLFVRYRARAYDNMYLIYKFFVQGNLRCLFTCL